MADTKQLNHTTAELDAAVTQVGELAPYCGKYKVVDRAATMAVNAATFGGDSVVSVSAATEVTSVDSLNYEVVFDVAANVALTIPSGIPTIGDVDNAKRRLFSFYRGTLVVGNF